MSELNGRQRFDLAMLCDGYERTPGDGIAEMAAIIRYIEAELIERGQISRHDEVALNAGCTALRLLNHRNDFVIGSFAFEVLKEAGFIDPDVEAIPF